MTWFLIGLAMLAGLFLSGFFSGAETGLYRINRLRLHLGVQQNKPDAIRLARVLGDETGALSVTLIGTNLSNYLTTAAVAYAFAELLQVGEASTELYTVVIVTPVIFVFGEMVPKNLFQLHADVLLARGSRLLSIADRVFRLTGLVAVLSRLAGLINRLVGSGDRADIAFGPRRRVAAMLREAMAGRSLFEDQSDLIERVCRLSDTPVHAVMVPRNRVRVIGSRADRSELLRVTRRTGHARLPVYEKSDRNIIGTVKVDGLLQTEDWKTVGERVQRIVTLSPHETVATAMTRLQAAGQGLAVVSDHGGKMLGIVTLKDLLREVIGELAEGI